MITRWILGVGLGLMLAGAVVARASLMLAATLFWAAMGLWAAMWLLLRPGRRRG